MNEFLKELADLLDKHDITIYADSNYGPKFINIVWDGPPPQESLSFVRYIDAFKLRSKLKDLHESRSWRVQFEESD